MNSFVFIIPRTPKQFRTTVREKLWLNTIKSLNKQSYTNWLALVIDDFNKKEGNIEFINSPAIKKGDKIQYALQLIAGWDVKPDYIIRLDDDDIIAPYVLEKLSNKSFDIATDRYHTYYELRSGLFCQGIKNWYPNTVAHKYEHAITIMPDGRPLLDQDHSVVWHNYYKNKNTLFLPKDSPFYVRVLSPTSITSMENSKYNKYVLSFGYWKNSSKLSSILPVKSIKNYSSVKKRIQITLNYKNLIKLFR
ncbi:hypothetical protein KEM09_11975 [Carboxylicivirga mesophila]|uniref:Glycosyltransferase 2-like domain-containing protein n=1 Tax=Carboxylicivirga mesophila TaxID=1166478 RepID=A0ABS5KB78_9BACT|nr:hypothetical protein [Carboxylicivirga mesophila]MBS2212127.1 hypothetical protein [Carboxylicivirga mesophila]